MQALAQQAVEAAQTAGAHYADARVTRIVHHNYGFGGFVSGTFVSDSEVVGVGVRALVNGYWGFAASPLRDADEAVRLARGAVAQAKVNARGTPRAVDLGTVPVATGNWTTPVAIDPFTVPIEEKLDRIGSWFDVATQYNVEIAWIPSRLDFVRQERVMASSNGMLVTQTCYETGGKIVLMIGNYQSKHPEVTLKGLEMTGCGWELFDAAHIPEQMATALDLSKATEALQRSAKPVDVGRYTLVCDGATMASMLEQTVGIATQLDRALGYEADAGGTSFIDDPLAMVGHLQVGSSLVTITGNRNAAGQLATVRWDDEGVVPESFPLVQHGVLVDFQTTREQAAWLAPYYQRQGQPVRSHGCAAAEDGLSITLQHMPNLALPPSATGGDIDALVAGVKDGVWIEGGTASVDFQARTGVLRGTMRKITNGRLDHPINGGAVLFNTIDFWKNVTAIGGAATTATLATSQYQGLLGGFVTPPTAKGQPPQMTSHSTQAVAATIANQPLIDLARKA
jgi:TldD protein